MNEEKTRLQRIKEQLSEKMARAIIEAIKDGEKIEVSSYGATVDGVFIAKTEYQTSPAIVIRLEAPEIIALFEPSKEQLQEKADKLKAELTEVENKLKQQEL